MTGHTPALPGPTTLVVAALALAVGTFAFRFAGPLLRTRISVPPWAEALLATSSVVLLTALVVTTTCYQGHGWAGTARPAGVLVGGVLAWRRLPFVAVILAAAGTTAALRLAGLR
ncbi:AzlD domain-containing protein [Kitasatospora sp. NBC_01266]|uniref:AzlD domain-containing protein n=1 Tax=Kitasatospora sp. NBC_01266 TaxID=2903572 RepID=UPI002E2FD1F9|nr:AzlD domain-containing protein [Kitasatospora sp. NBC_01266]